MEEMMPRYLLAFSTLFLFTCSDDSTAPQKETVSASDLGKKDTPATKGDTTEKKDGPSKTDGKGSLDSHGISFATSVQPIFAASCASATCHSGSSPKASMDLSEGKAHASLVDVTSVQCQSLKRVKPGSDTESYLIQKLNGSGSCFANSPMPPPSGGLDAAKIQSIKRWIIDGAKND
jgi:hypothetical protein